MITVVILFTNGMLMVFNDLGEQMPEYQGKKEDSKSKILEKVDTNVKFFISKWGHWKNEITREEFVAL